MNTTSTENKNIIPEWELIERYDDMLQETFGMVSVMGFEYPTPQVLKDTDPTAYWVGLDEFADSLIEAEEIDGIDGW